MKRNPAREALNRAVNKAIADGAPVYVNQPATMEELESENARLWKALGEESAQVVDLVEKNRALSEFVKVNRKFIGELPPSA